MKPKSVKSQITMLMIVGLLLFILVSLVLYLSKSVVKKQSQQSVKKTQVTAIEIQPIKEFVTKCLDKLGKDAILLLGKQGGYIYKSQGGELVDFRNTDEGLFFIKYNNFNVAYNIVAPRFSVSKYSSDIPYYPWETFPYNTEGLEEDFEGYYGLSLMPPLNSSGGPNSIQAQIETFIDNNIDNCIDIKIFEGQGLDILIRPSNTSVRIGSSDVIIESRIPIVVTNSNTKEYYELNDFSTRLDIRLKDIYFFAKKLIGNDINNIKFNISAIKNNQDFFTVQAIKNVLLKDDVITITDEKSFIYGKPYEYTFARKNRVPALYYIDPNEFYFEQGYLIQESDLLKSELKAEDPDEDSYFFKIIPLLPFKLDIPQIKFKVIVNDSQLIDYQIINVNKQPIT